MQMIVNLQCDENVSIVDMRFSSLTRFSQLQIQYRFRSGVQLTLALQMAISVRRLCIVYVQTVGLILPSMNCYENHNALTSPAPGFDCRIISILP